jgi:hypothetical protein
LRIYKYESDKLKSRRALKPIYFSITIAKKH